MRARAILAVTVGALASVTAPFMTSCGRPCRAITVTPLELQCETDAVYEGELHYDDAAVFESFLSQDCLPSSSPDQIAGLVDSVDFLTNAVFVAVGRRQVAERCVEERDAAAVQVCDDGLRVAFDDRLSTDAECLGRWTVAFALAREDLRAALGDDVAGQ